MGYVSDLIKQCDYYIVIVAGRYGSLTTEGVSFTQKEYEFAVQNGIPTIAFVHATPEELPLKKVDTDPRQKKRLDDFTQKLKKRLCKEWHNADELGAVVSRSLTQLIKREPRAGWIRASDTRSVEDATEIINLNKRIKELEERLKRYEGVGVSDVSMLCDGEDLFEFDYTFNVCTNAKEYYGKEILKNHRERGTLSWNKIFSAIAPHIMSAARETSVKNALSQLLKVECEASIAVKLKQGEYLDGFKLMSLSFDVIKVQLQALGLITINREILDAGNVSNSKENNSKTVTPVWRLTDRGSRRMYEILAIKKHR